MNLTLFTNKIKGNAEKMIEYQRGVIAHCSNFLEEVTNIIRTIDTTMWHSQILESFELYVKKQIKTKEAREGMEKGFERYSLDFKTFSPQYLKPLTDCLETKAVEIPDYQRVVKELKDCLSSSQKPTIETILLQTYLQSTKLYPDQLPNYSLFYK